MKRFLFYPLCAFLLFSCSENDLIEHTNTREEDNKTSTNVQLSLNQAVAYAGLFSQRFEALEEQGNEQLKTRSSTK